MDAIYFNRAYDNIRRDGKRESDELALRLAKVFPQAVWHKETDDLWKIVVE